MTPRYQCPDCNDIHAWEQRLIAQHPFNPADLIFGCPECKSVCEPDRVCDEIGCGELAYAATPHGKGQYKVHCHKHPPTAKDASP